MELKLDITLRLPDETAKTLRSIADALYAWGSANAWQAMGRPDDVAKGTGAPVCPTMTNEEPKVAPVSATPAPPEPVAAPTAPVEIVPKEVGNDTIVQAMKDLFARLYGANWTADKKTIEPCKYAIAQTAVRLGAKSGKPQDLVGDARLKFVETMYLVNSTDDIQLGPDNKFEFGVIPF